MFTESAELYDTIYAGFKNYAAEAAQIAALLRRIRPGCRTVLDVACGTRASMRDFSLLTMVSSLMASISSQPSFSLPAESTRPASSSRPT